jgi:uroporphyrinogen-III synthase
VGHTRLASLTIGITAERVAETQAELLHNRGAKTLHGPTLRLFSLSDDEILHCPDHVESDTRSGGRRISSIVVGMRAWLSAADAWGLRMALLEALSKAKVANRGAKAASANKAVGLSEWYRAPNERFDELVERVQAQPLAGSRVVLQLHAMAVPEAVVRLGAAGAEVIEVDAYRASLPTDRASARDLIEEACAQRLAAVTFITATALHNLFLPAQEHRRGEELRRAFNGPVVAACVGPVCAEGALEEGILAPLVPPRSRLVPLVHVLTDRLRRSHGTGNVADHGVE